MIRPLIFFINSMNFRRRCIGSYSVYYNDQTGDIKFLILDPHLTRLDENLKYIQDKVSLLNT